MSLTQELRQKYRGLWRQMVTHPFVVEMGEGTLPIAKFRTYFVQDYLFGKSIIPMVAMGISKAPDFDAARQLNQFLTLILDPEKDLFYRAFRELGIAEAEYSTAGPFPTTQAFGDFMVRVGYEGNFEDVITVLYVTEGTYLDWGTQLIEAGKRPQNRIYREWIEIHGPQVLGELVRWLGDYLDQDSVARRRPQIENVFHSALRYEYLFWEAAYRGERWPDG